MAQEVGAKSHFASTGLGAAIHHLVGLDTLFSAGADRMTAMHFGVADVCFRQLDVWVDGDRPASVPLSATPSVTADRYSSRRKRPCGTLSRVWLSRLCQVAPRA